MPMKKTYNTFRVDASSGDRITCVSGDAAVIGAKLTCEQPSDYLLVVNFMTNSNNSFMKV